MKLESSAFAANGLIPPKYTCDGQNISPPIQWDQPPAETQSFALIVDDPDAPGRTFVHWVVYDIPAVVCELPQQVPTQKTLANGSIQGKNDFGKFGYGGPCPPSGTHRYFFKLYALDKTLGLAEGATKDKVLAAMEGHILASVELIGRYSRQR
jgi:Raf kinase inhibitor-like YbhB/YbcL family protein